MMNTQLCLTTARNAGGDPVMPIADTNDFELALDLGAAMSLITGKANRAAISPVVCFETTLPDSYTAGLILTVKVNAGYIMIGGGAPAKATLGLAAYVLNETTGVMSQDEGMSNDVTLSAAPADYPFQINGAALTPGCRLLIALDANLTESNGGDLSAIIRSARLTA